MSYSFEGVKEKIDIALYTLFHKDSQLLKYQVSERAVSHKLAEYLQILFPEWHVDCEYNLREENLVKELRGIQGCDEQKKTERIYPDIIVHHRGVRENLLVIEIKTGGQEDPCDKRKLELFTEREGEYGYDWGLYIQFNGRYKPALTWYRDGNIYE